MQPNDQRNCPAIQRCSLAQEACHEQRPEKPPYCSSDLRRRASGCSDRGLHHDVRRCRRKTGQQRRAARYDWPSPSPSATRHSPGRACSELALRYLFKFSDAIVIKSPLSKWLHDAATNTGQPNLVLAMISVLLAATIVFILRESLLQQQAHAVWLIRPTLIAPSCI